MQFAPDGRTVAVGSGRGNRTDVRFGNDADPGMVTGQRLALLDARTGRTVWERAHPKYVWEAHVGFTPDGALITSAAQGKTIVWDARRGRILRRYPIGGLPAISPHGERVALALNGPSPGDPHTAIGVLNLRTGKSRTLADNLPNTMSDGLAFTRDGKRIIGGTYEGTHVWDMRTGSIVETFNAPRRRIRHGVVMDPQG